MENKLTNLVNFCGSEHLSNLQEALNTAKKFNSSEINAAIIKRSDLSYLRMMTFLEEIELDWTIREAIAQREDFDELSYKMISSFSLEEVPQYSGGILIGVNYSYSKKIVKIVLERKILNKFSLSNIIDYARKADYNFEVLKTLSDNDQWQKKSFKEKCAVVNEHSHNASLTKLVIESSTCSFAEAIRLLKESDDPTWVSYSIIEKSDFSTSDILEELPATLKNLEEGFESIWTVIQKTDCSKTQGLSILNELISLNADISDVHEAASVIIEKPIVSFEEALRVAEIVDFHPDVLESFDDRKDFSLEQRNVLVASMDAHVPYMYMEKKEEPSYDSFNYRWIIERGDWATRPLHEVFLVADSASAYLQIIEREDWKQLSYEESLALAERVNYKGEVLSYILKLPCYDFKKSLDLLKKSGPEPYHCWALSSVIETSGCTFDEALGLLKDSREGDHSSIAIRIAKNPDFTLMQVANLMLKSYQHQGNIAAAVYNHQGWKLESLEEVFNLLGQGIMYVGETVMGITQRDDWKNLSFSKAQELLIKGKIDKKSNHFQQFLPTLLAKEGCTGKKALVLIEEVDLNREFSKEIVIPIISKDDISLDEALELAGKTLFSAYSAITKRSDWKRLSKFKLLDYLKKYDSIDLRNSIVDRGDWKRLSFSKALVFVGRKDLSHFGYFDYLALVIRHKSCSFDEAVSLAKENEYPQSIVEAIIVRDDCTLKKALEIAPESVNCSQLILKIIKQDYWKSVSVKKALKIARNKYKNTPWINTEFIFMNAISKLENWSSLSTAKRLNLLKKTEYVDSMLTSVEVPIPSDAV